MNDQSTKRPQVFISYSHDDEAWKDRVRDALRAGGLEPWDDRLIDPGDPWHPSILRAIDESAAAICLITPRFLTSKYCRNREIPALREQRAATGMPIIPILIEPSPWRESEWLRPTQMDPPDGRTVTIDLAGSEDAFFADVADRLLTRLAPGVAMRRGWRKPLGVDIGRLPRSGATIHGREGLIDDLDSAWHSSRTHVVSLVGAPGVGKSTLVEAWLAELAEQNYRGARRVYGWSFQTRRPGDPPVSADRFFDNLFHWLGEKAPPRASPWERGNRLAQLVRRNPMLLVLDGVEALQADDGDEAVSVRDPGLARLLTELERDNRGLVVLTSRRPIADLEHTSHAVRQIHLDILSSRAGAAVLEEGGLSSAGLENLSKEFGNHALALVLLASYLRGTPADDVAAIVANLPEPGPEQDAGRHPRRLLAAFEQRLGNGAELRLLEALALFDGPSNPGALDHLRRAAIPGLSDQLQSLAPEAWNALVGRLRSDRLIQPPSDYDPEELDLHPLVREHFHDRLRSRDEHAWRNGHERLYRYFRSNAPRQPNRPAQLQPHYSSIRHGCKAGWHQEALDEVYWKRILRGDEQFSWRILGQIESDLSAISHFFSTRWSEPADGIVAEDAGFVVGQAAMYLGMSGHLSEAVPLLELGIARDLEAGRVANASVTSSNLAHSRLLLGDLEGSIEAARQSVAYADRADDTDERIISRTTLGCALHRASRLDEAEAQFGQAEKIQSSTSGMRFLYAGQGREYGDLLLDQGRWSDAQARAAANLASGAAKVVPEQTHIAACRAQLAELRQRNAGNVAAAQENIESAVSMLRECGQMDMLPVGLLARADLYRFQFRMGEALDDIEETLELCVRCGMRLHEVDALVLRADVLATRGERGGASDAVARAEELAKMMDYRWHDAELARLRVRLGKGGNP